MQLPALLGAVSWPLRAALVLLVSGLLPLFHLPSVAAQPANPTETITMPGLRFSLPAGWVERGNGLGMVGRETLILVAPACAPTRAVLCHQADQPEELALAITVERAASRATPPGDEQRAKLRAAGLVPEAVQIAGIAAERYREPTETWAEKWLLEHAGVYYHIFFSRALSASPEGQATLTALIASIELTPESAPAPFVPAFPPTQQTNPLYLPLLASVTPESRSLAERLLQRLLAPVLQQAPVTNPVLAYALEYGDQRTNSDGCYVAGVTGDTANCNIPIGNGVIGFDGVHFVDCALKQIDFPGSICNGTITSVVNAGALLTILQNAKAPVRLIDKVRLGDVMIVAPDTNLNDPCWAGIVTALNPIRVAVHSTGGGLRDEINVDPTALFCQGPEDASLYTKTYYAINAAPPEVTITAPIANGRIAPFGAILSYTATDDGALGELTFDVQIRYSNGTTATLLSNSPATSVAIPANTPCQAVELTVIARDDLGLLSEPAARSLNVTLRGDADNNRQLDRSDLAALERAFGARSGEGDYLAVLDLNEDGRIDRADRILLTRQLTNRCA